MHGFFSGLVILLPWSVCLFLCQYHRVLIIIILSESMMLPALLVFLRIALAIQSLLRFHTNFRIVYSTLFKKCHWNLDRDCTESMSSMDILIILILPICEPMIYFQLFILQFLSSVSYSCQCTDPLPPWLSLFLSVLQFLMLL